MSASKEEKKQIDESPQPQKEEFSQEIRDLALQILQTKYRINFIYGVHVEWDAKTKKYEIKDESPNEICILARLKGKAGNRKDQDFDLRAYPEFRALNIPTASAAKLAFIALVGYVIRNLELEHVCHRHMCININHHFWVTKKNNLHREACKKDLLDEQQERNQGQFGPMKGSKTFVKTTCDHGPDIPQCMFNLCVNDASRWQKPKEKRIFYDLIQKSIPGVILSPFD